MNCLIFLFDKNYIKNFSYRFLQDRIRKGLLYIKISRSLPVGLDSEKRVFSEKMRKEGKGWEKDGKGGY